ncbi:hypothetical protein ACIG56_27015 [Nocardia fusca]|uniref:hypothetical protein n=1 Tax=Nocardia fusca TaxID=941183 RepID=UPI0037C8269A
MAFEIVKSAHRKLRMRRPGPAQDLSAALRTVSEVNRVIAATDTKVGLLLTANGFALTGLIAGSRTHTNLLTSGLGIALGISVLVCMVYMAAALRPDLRGAGTGNWFSFPSFPAEIGRRPSTAALADHAWREASLLADVARRKYRRFALALRWSSVSLIMFVVWFIASSLSGTGA